MQSAARLSNAVRFPWVGALVLGLFAGGCERTQTPGASASPSAAAVAPATPPAEETLEPAPEATPLPPGIAGVILKPFKGDLDGMVKRRVIRVLTVQNPILYFVDRGREVGSPTRSIKDFEKQLNEKLGNTIVTVHVVAIPVARDQLIPRLLAGEGDIAAAILTVTPERKKQVDFSDPFASGVREVLVTGPDTPPVASIDELSGKELYVRPSSSYAEHLKKLNERFEAAGKPPVTITPAPEVLEDGDILEMVNAGLVPATVVDDFMADLYTQVFPNLRKNSDIASPPGDIAWAFRKGSPKLAEAVNAFVRTHKQGSLAGNVLINKYVKTTKWVKNARSDEDRKRFQSMVGAVQEVREAIRPRLPADGGPGLPGVRARSDQAQPRGGDRGHAGHARHGARQGGRTSPTSRSSRSNIHAGIKYNRWVVDNFYNDPAITPLDKELFAFASYNAGPGRVASLRKQATAEGLDPEQVVQQRGAGGGEADRPRDRDLREQHLQVLPGVPDDHSAN